MAQLATSGSLAALGIGLAREQVYRAVLRSPGSTTDFLADRVGRSADEVMEDVAALAESGLVAVAHGVVTAEQPQLALGRLLAREARQLVAAESALAQARLQISHYEVEHQVGLKPGNQTAELDLIEPTDITNTLESLMLTTVGEMLFLRPDQWRIPGGRVADLAAARALRSGRESRALYPTGISGEYQELIRQRVEAGERIRLLPHVPCRLAVFGDQAVVIPQTWGGPSGTALLCRQPGIVSACREWFEELWNHGVGLPELGQPSDRRSRAQLLDLLARGVKDERIARTLGVSLRTVRRRIAELLAELGVESRFQAGVEAVRRGWL